MTKTLTQDVFKGAPDWVNSAAVDEDGYAWGYAVDTLFLSIDDNGDKWIANFGKCMCLGKGYDTADWQNSAIDREWVRWLKHHGPKRPKNKKTSCRTV